MVVYSHERPPIHSTFRINIPTHRTIHMTQPTLSMIQQAQYLKDAEQRTFAMLSEMASRANITLTVLCEDVLNVLTNLASNAQEGKGLIAMGGNVNNYAYFL